MTKAGISTLSSVIAVVTVSIHLALIYARTERVLEDFFDRRHEIENNKQEIRRLTEEGRTRDERDRIKAEQNRMINDKLNQCLAQKAVKLSYNF